MFRDVRQDDDPRDQAPPRLTACPNTATGRATLAHALLCDGQYDAALAELEIALGDNPELADAQLVKGLTLVRLGQDREAIAPLERAMASSEHARDAALSLISVYLRLEWFERALEVAGVLLRQDADDAQAQAAWGEALSRSGQPVDAIDAFRRAVELDPTSAPAQLRLGELLCADGQLEQALAVLVTAIRLAPRNIRALQTMAVILRRKGRGAEAVAVYRRALGAGLPTAELHLEMAECFLEEANVFAAVSCARMAMALAPQNADCHRLLGRIYAEQGRASEAREFEESANRLSENESSAQGNAAANALKPGTPSCH